MVYLPLTKACGDWCGVTTTPCSVMARQSRTLRMLLSYTKIRQLNSAMQIAPLRSLTKLGNSAKMAFARM